MRLFSSSVVLTLCFALPKAAQAWGAEGHRLIAELAETQLTPNIRAEVDRLLGMEPGATMASIATWADEIRSPSTAPWHYVNPPEGDCSFDRARDCATGQCAVEALTRQVKVLKAKGNDGERLVALKWVVHLVGDLHQPLHAGFKADKGGNQYQVQAFGRGSNLHSLWDGRMIRQRPGGLDALRQSATTAGVATAEAPQSASWAIESCKIVVSPGFYPDGHRIDQRYMDQWDAVMIARIKGAAHRLAATLNDAMR